MSKGKVFLVGAGPGDIGLISIKGLEAIKKAEVILYDRLANPKLLEFAPADCELIYCGKLPDRHFLRQENINALLVEKALEGKRVVRLKGGDPGVFGRVGEEAAALAEHEISFELVPGISSGIAAPLYAGIPVTHREHGESFAVVTAHDKSQDGKPLLDWEGLARGVDTIAFYMGVGNLPYIAENLVKYGKPAQTPVILIQWGTFGRQKTLQGTLADIAEKAAAGQFSNPAIILVGSVISLREKISWFEKKPLHGRQILLARTSSGPSSLAEMLTEQGADVIEFPKWKRVLVPFDITKAVAYDKVLFSSPDSVEEFFAAMVKNKLDIRSIRADFYGRSLKTIRALNERSCTAALMEEMPGTGSLLVVQDEGDSSPAIEKADYLVVSRKELDERYGSIFKRMLGDADINTVVFPSSASVAPFVQALESCGIRSVELLEKVEVISMGRLTEEAAVAAGIRSSGRPEEATKDALVKYLMREN